jgi:hypothetical protein
LPSECAEIHLLRIAPRVSDPKPANAVTQWKR